MHGTFAQNSRSCDDLNLWWFFWLFHSSFPNYFFPVEFRHRFGVTWWAGLHTFILHVIERAHTWGMLMAGGCIAHSTRWSNNPCTLSRSTVSCMSSDTLDIHNLYLFQKDKEDKKKWKKFPNKAREVLCPQSKKTSDFLFSFLAPFCHKKTSPTT